MNDDRQNESFSNVDFINMQPNGVLELLDGNGNVAVRFYRVPNENPEEELRSENAKLRELISILLVVRKYTISCNPLDCKSCRVEKECREGTRLAKDLGFNYKEIKVPGYPDYKTPDYL